VCLLVSEADQLSHLLLRQPEQDPPRRYSSPAGSCVWHVVGLQRSVREGARRQGWGGRPVEQKEARGNLVAALGMLAVHFGYGDARRVS
jgi:hypothetical protein